MNIREVKTSDLDQLSILFNSYRIFYGKESNIDISKKFLESRISNKDSKMFICEVNNILTGFVQLYPLFSSVRVSKYWLLNDLFIDSEFRGKGYSKLLIYRAKELVLESGACGMMLETEKSNKIGNSLYPKTGFKINDLSNFYEWVPS
ncbi:GNAT family N-acetyltransferase [Flavobacteriaceae bacterium]|jgi:GNAT superfamily N-acetyltransferase|nr:GNAT family N-acetyltransferase [Flavobacteriales bacterium]MDA8547197.1 GNAT family N-acetyltransferase [Flavobacteriaceae bacterium]MDA9160369.1 GNAT family N-acetyltransferase [Flavobacteriaceae bacterium]MDA9203446.1 GNAT family N-acetyltransferase [Flavobacteriaceae bacterium]MDA9818701.1 GNAT family N-acetyltransferase [Flavobacteriaceae bacterium]|tara:strand:+ start:1700 stop:2143 length:444 start_codon:yes stop_codon:yes gene_type:complete